MNIFKNDFCFFRDSEILGLPGGRKRICNYILAVSEIQESDFFTSCVEIRLLNQMGSQTLKYRKGYELVRVFGEGQKILDLEKMTLKMPRLKLSDYADSTRLWIAWDEKPVRFLAPGSGEQQAIIQENVRLAEIQHKIRRFAARSREDLKFVLSLLAYADQHPIGKDPADRFERLLVLRAGEYLRQLLSRLEMPDPGQYSSE